MPIARIRNNQITTMRLSQKKKIELFYDVLSPYTWFAFEVLMRYKKVWPNVNIELKPFMLAEIMKGSGNKPPGLVPNKGRYLTGDVIRCAKYFDVPLQLLKDPVETMFVKGSSKMQHFLTAISMKNPDRLEDVTRALWHQLWSCDKDVTDETVLTEAARKGGMSATDINTCLSLVSDQSVKDKLRAYCDEALDYGAFGSPIIIVHTEDEPVLFFGADRFPILAQELGLPWLGPKPKL